MAKYVVVKLTFKEGRMLDAVAGNGWADGDFGEWLNNGREAIACERAMLKLRQALQAAGAYRDGAQSRKGA